MPQKPVRWSYEQNPEEVQKWLEETYPAIRRKAHREGAMILWDDEMGMRWDYSAGRCYGKKGVQGTIYHAGMPALSPASGQTDPAQDLFDH